MIRHRAALPFALATVSAAYACGGTPPPSPVVPAPSAATSASTAAPVPKSPLADKMLGLEADDEASLDRSISPCDDFYQFACGGWLTKNSIPDDESSWMRSFSTIRAKNEATLRALLEPEPKPDAKAKTTKGKAPAAPKAKPGKSDPDTERMRSFYASCMDEEEIEKQGTKPLAAEIAAIHHIKAAGDVAAVLGTLHGRGVSAFFSVESMQDFADSTKVVAGVDQDGLGLPDRDYYLKNEGTFPHLREAYVTYLTTLFTLAGEPSPKELAQGVLAFETKLATAQMSKEDRRDPKKLNHPFTADTLAKQAPDFAWKAYFGALGSSPADLNASHPTYLTTVGDMVAKSETPEAIRAYLLASLFRSSAGLLGKAWVEAQFAFTREVRGQKALAPRWKRCVRATDAAVGEALGKAFVTKTLGDAGKSVTRDMVVAIERSMGERLNAIAWMDGATKAAARQKLAKVANKIASPDKYRDYSSLTFGPKTYFANGVAARRFEVKRDLLKVGKPVDRTEWQMTPPTVNAYYDPSLNEMVFPAGILQPPFFSNTSSQAKNLGGIGMVMGHELTHGFDDEGRQFDGDGNLRDFWTPKAGEEFERRAACVEKQFNGFVVNGEHVNGKLTEGENIADLGGIALAYASLVSADPQAAEPHGDSATPAQQFFLGFAQGWCGKYTDEMMRQLVATNPHSPPKFRVNGPLANTPAFAAAFHCSEGQPMAATAKDRCTIW